MYMYLHPYFYCFNIYITGRIGVHPLKNNASPITAQWYGKTLMKCPAIIRKLLLDVAIPRMLLFLDFDTRFNLGIVGSPGFPT